MMVFIFFAVMTDAYLSACTLLVAPSAPFHFSYPSLHHRLDG